MTRSLLRIAEEALVAFSAEEDGPAFAFIREAHDPLLAVGRESDIRSEVKMAAFSLAGFGEQILEDLTGAVPWDEMASLRQTRIKAIELLKEGYERFEAVQDEGADLSGFFGALGDIRSRYESMIEDLNEKDRQLLTKPLGGPK